MTRPNIESPCIKVCAVDGQTGLCLGCGRSLKEIGGWMQFDDAGRITDAEREREELEVIMSFLPEPLSGDALQSAAAEIVSKLQASKLKDVGRCMTALREKYPGRIECGPASKAVRAAIG